MEIINGLIEYLSKEGISIDLIKTLEPIFTLKSFQKAETILNMGENTKVVCLILMKRSTLIKNSSIFL